VLRWVALPLDLVATHGTTNQSGHGGDAFAGEAAQLAADQSPGDRTHDGATS